MYQLIYASISHTHYWYEVGMMYLFTIMVAAPVGTLFFHSSVLHQPLQVHPCPCNMRISAEYLYSKMDALTSGSGKI